MTLRLYDHPSSSYSQKVLTALYENHLPFTGHLLQGPDSPAMQELARRWPLKRFPVLVDGAHTVLEASCIVEHLGLHHPGPVRLIPADAAPALDVRMPARFFDNDVATPQQKIVSDALREPADCDAYGVAQAREMPDTAYAWLDGHMAWRTWGAGDHFSLAGCAAAPHRD